MHRIGLNDITGYKIETFVQKLLEVFAMLHLNMFPTKIPLNINTLLRHKSYKRILSIDDYQCNVKKVIVAHCCIWFGVKCYFYGAINIGHK